MKDKILNRLIQIITTEGFHKLTIDELSRYSGVSRRTLYKYFSSKDEILDAIHEYLSNQIRSKIKKIIELQNASPLEKFKLFTDELSKGMPAPSRKFMEDMNQHRPDLVVKMINEQRETMKSFVVVLRHAQKMKIISNKVDPELAIDILIAMAEGILSPAYLMKSDYSLRVATAAVLSIFFNGISNHKVELDSK